MRGTPRCSSILSLHQRPPAGPFNPFLFVALPSQGWGFPASSPAVPGGFPCHVPGRGEGRRWKAGRRKVQRQSRGWLWGAEKQSRVRSLLGGWQLSVPQSSLPLWASKQCFARVTPGDGTHRAPSGVPSHGRETLRGDMGLCLLVCTGHLKECHPADALNPGLPPSPRDPAHSPHLSCGACRLMGPGGTPGALRARCHPSAVPMASWCSRDLGLKDWASRRC